MNRSIQGRYLTTLFADDVREEVGGKLSLIGIYQEKMLVPEFPCVLPKLSVLIFASTPIDEPFLKVEVALLKNEATVFSFDIPEERLRVREDGMDRSKLTAQELQIVHVMPGFVIEIPSVLQVRLTTEQGVLLSRPFQIEHMPLLS